jgi:hypothetical protein
MEPEARRTMTLDDARPKSAPCDVVTSRGDGRVYKRKGSSRYWIQYSVRGCQYREPGGRTPAAARKKLRQRLREAGIERFGGPAAERVTVDQLADALLVHMKNQGRASADKIRCHLMISHGGSNYIFFFFDWFMCQFRALNTNALAKTFCQYGIVIHVN